MPQPAATDPETVRRTAWFREAKYGLLITWGLYSLPAGEWNGKPYPGLGEWLMNTARIPVANYARLAGRFNPERFDAEAWVLLARRAGMKYIVGMSKRHDGFAMFHSRVTPFNIVDAAPFQRDPMQELAAACRKHDMRLGFYYSQSQDWHHLGGAVSGGSWDPAQQGGFDAYLERIALPQVREPLTNYGPVALIWFDTPIDMTPERAERFVKLVRDLQPNCLINGRLDAERHGFDYASMRDNQVFETGMQSAWETPATINDTWGYRRDDHNWKPSDTIVYRLVDIVSKGGNYLLNVGPTGDGEIPEPSLRVLDEVGEWLSTNAEAIYGAGRTPFGAELAASSIADSRFVYRKPTGWRCTTKVS
ncbi:MAG: alpha-L-fucosidase [Bryobacteraceae bacterium]|jgi:alpha-L-fucosidase